LGFFSGCAGLVQRSGRSAPACVEKVRDIVGLYLSPPSNALVLCVDEKSQCQALERTQRLLPMGLGYLEGVTHDYVRHGTTTLFAALNAATGEVFAQCKARHRHQEFIAFLNDIEGAVPAELELHLILDNYATHKHPKVKAWLAKHRRYHLHFTPTYSSWLNQVERWFGIITQQAIRADPFAACASWFPTSNASSINITSISAHSAGQLPPIPSSRRSSVYVKLFMGQHTMEIPSAVAGGMRLPTFRMVNRSPG
jgi:transposase